MSLLFETERLLFREFILEDAIHLFELNNDPEVIRYTGDDRFRSEDEAEQFIKNYTAYKNTGIGRYAVLHKETSEFLGWCGLKYHPDKRSVDLGCRFHQKFWNQGFATESSLGTIGYAFNRLKLPFLIAHAHVANRRSQRVLEKCKYSLTGKEIYDQQPTLAYQLENSDYHLRFITAQETWPVRHPVLRAGKPLEDVYMEADDKESTFHIGMFYKNVIVGVASFMDDEKPEFTGKQSRLRGMAVLPNFRKKGIAQLILQKGEKILKEKMKTTLWFNARVGAVRFYKNLGYTVLGSEFIIPKIGIHYLMKKKL